MFIIQTPRICTKSSNQKNLLRKLLPSQLPSSFYHQRILTLLCLCSWTLLRLPCDCLSKASNDHVWLSLSLMRLSRDMTYNIICIDTSVFKVNGHSRSAHPLTERFVVVIPEPITPHVFHLKNFIVRAMQLSGSPSSFSTKLRGVKRIPHLLHPHCSCSCDQ